jgi:hypothetical protein
MKAVILFCLMVSVLILGCVPQKRPSVEGAWKLVYFTSVKGDTLVGEFPGKWTGSDMKMWSKGYFAFVGRYKTDTTFSDGYGGGRYKLDGNRYEEIIQYHTWTSAVGDTVKMLLEVRSDTLVQTWPVHENGQIDKSNFQQEKYIRLD